MADFSIQTAQNIKINQRLAGISERIFAFIIDMIFIALIYIVIFYLLIKADVFNSNIEIYAFILVLTLPAFLYYPLFQYWNNGQTLGKMFMKIRVVKTDNSHPKLLDFIIRWVFRLVEVNMIPGLAFLVILLSDKRQRLGDMVAKTTVVSEKKPVGLNQSIFRDVQENYQPIFPEVRQFSDEHIQLIKDIYEQSKLTNNREILRQLVSKIQAIYQIQKPKGMPDKRFINIILKDYNYFSNQ